MKKKRPHFIRNWRDLEQDTEWKSPATGDIHGYPVDFGRVTGLSRLKLMHLRLPPGRRSNIPGGYRDEEEFFLVLGGRGDLWIDGYLYAVGEGDTIWFEDRTGIAHTIINNSDAELEIFVFGEATRMASQFFVPLERDAAGREVLARQGKLWRDPPKKKLGPHDGISDRERGAAGPNGGRRKGKPSCVVNWRDFVGKWPAISYPDSKETNSIDALMYPPVTFSRIGVHVEVLRPGRRSSWPHAERDEEEFVYVISGAVDCWLDGYIHPMTEGDFVGWEARTGITHVVINNSDEDAVLLVGGEASRKRSQFWYPFHPAYNKEIGSLYWADHPVPKLGPHDGLPDRLRAGLPPAARRSATAANAAAHRLGMRKRS
jgi:uncharacterized cupin superfamily protein